MPTLRLTGISPQLDGDYDLDVASFTNRELHTIKQLTGVRAGELQAALQAGDNDLTVAFTVILIRRAGKTVDPDQIWDADISAVEVIPDAEDEAQPRPPVSASPNGQPSEHDGDARHSEHTASSGSASSDSGDEHPNGPSLTGLPGLETPAPSDPETLAS